MTPIESERFGMPSSPKNHVMYQNSDASSSSSNPPPSPTRLRTQPTPLRLQSIGVDPNILIGRVLTCVRRSPIHPSLTLGFSDGTSFQILMDGYDPVHRGIPKALEMDASLSPVFDPPGGRSTVELLVADCVSVTLTDKAFARISGQEQRWDQSHLGIAFRFGEERRWHCMWATLAEYDADHGGCTFRSYDDLYLEQSARSPRPPRQPNPGKHDRHDASRRKGSWRQGKGRASR